jgi:hypothetical protein
VYCSSPRDIWPAKLNIVTHDQHGVFSVSNVDICILYDEMFFVNGILLHSPWGAIRGDDDKECMYLRSKRGEILGVAFDAVSSVRTGDSCPS